ncbi:MAG: hypothetical protein N2558_00195 [Patescibacteria group bacterium]|nr:hypothetical protein [Patescibacteria group bacterium]
MLALKSASQPELRNACINYTLGKFVPFVDPVLDCELDSGGDIYSAPQPYEGDVKKHLALRSKLVDQYYEEQAKLYRERPELLTEDKLKEFEKEFAIVRFNFGKEIFSDARTRELVRILSFEEAVQLFGDQFESWIEEDTNVNWRVFSSIDGENATNFLLLKNKVGDEIKLESVKIEEIDRQFLFSRITEYRKKQVMAYLARSIRYDIMCQSIPEDQVLPPFLIELGNIQDEKEREEIRALMLTCLNSPVWQQASMGFIEKLRQSVKLESYSFSPEVYLDHVLDHPARTSAAKERAKFQRETLEMINNRTYAGSVEFPYPDSDAISEQDVRSVLGDFYRFACLPGLKEPSIKQEFELNKKVREFSKKVIDVEDLDQLQGLLRNEFPDYYDTLVKFKQWLGSYLYDEIIKGIVSRMETAILLSSHKDEDLLSILDAELQIQLLRHSLGKKQFEGIHFEPDNRRVSFYNQRLTMILPLFALKALQVKLSNKVNMGISMEYINKQVSICKEAVQRHFDNYIQRYLVSDQDLSEELHKISSDRQLFLKFASPLGIGSEDVDVINNIATKITDENKKYCILDIYLALSTLLYLEKVKPQTKRCLQSLAFREFLKYLFPRISDEDWQRYFDFRNQANEFSR